MSINLNVALPTSVFKVLNLRQARILTALTVLCILLAVSFAAQRTSAAGEALVWVDPPQWVVSPGQVFNVSIQVDNLPTPTGAAGFQVVLRWDPSVLTALNTTEVMFHSVTPPEEWGSQIWRIEDKINNTIGYIYYAYAFQDWRLAVSEGYAPITGNHTLATYTFQGINTGYTTLDLWLIKIGDVNADEVPWTKVDGEVTVGNPPPTITIDSPVNETYSNRSSVDLMFRVSKPVVWIGYSLDQHLNVTVEGETEIQTVDGPHSIVMYGNDSLGQMGKSDIVFFLLDATPPTVSLACSPPTPEAEILNGNFKWSFLFNGSASEDATTSVSSYYWDFGDGSNTTDVASLHVYNQPGTYHVKLTVTDLLGNSASQEKIITLDPASKPLEIPYGLIVVIIIPAVWIPSLFYYFSRARRTRGLRRKAQLRQGFLTVRKLWGTASIFPEGTRFFITSVIP